MFWKCYYMFKSHISAPSKTWETAATSWESTLTRDKKLLLLPLAGLQLFHSGLMTQLHRQNLSLVYDSFLTFLSPKLSILGSTTILELEKKIFSLEIIFFPIGSSETSYVEYQWAGLTNSRKKRSEKYTITMFITSWSHAQLSTISTNFCQWELGNK